MPYASEKQRRYLHWKHPDIAERWDAEEVAQKNVRRRRRRTILTDSTTYALPS